MSSRKKYFSIYIIITALLLNACELSVTDNSLADVIDEQELLYLVNDLRKSGCQCGDTYMEASENLEWDNELERAAKVHSIDMNVESYFSHTSLNGDTYVDRINGTNYTGDPRGENIAVGFSNEESVFQAWKNSPGHCRNMMNPGHTDIAVGRSGAYWTMVFGKK